MNAVAEKQSIPDKLFFKIGEVSRLAGVEPYVLRYWETEFSFLKPRKNRAGQRVYLRKDVDKILQVRTLLYEEKYTIAGVRRRLSGNIGRINPAKNPVNNSNPTERLERVKEGMRSILRRFEKEF